jgi:hypothetical protein
MICYYSGTEIAEKVFFYIKNFKIDNMCQFKNVKRDIIEQKVLFIFVSHPKTLDFIHLNPIIFNKRRKLTIFVCEYLVFSEKINEIRNSSQDPLSRMIHTLQEILKLISIFDSIT